MSKKIMGGHTHYKPHQKRTSENQTLREKHRLKAYEMNAAH